MVLKLVKEVLRVGEATVLYPFVPAEVYGRLPRQAAA